MLVNPFWFGVLMTIVVEILLCIVYAMFDANKRGRK